MIGTTWRSLAGSDSLPLPGYFLCRFVSGIRTRWPVIGHPSVHPGVASRLPGNDLLASPHAPAPGASAWFNLITRRCTQQQLLLRPAPPPTTPSSTASARSLRRGSSTSCCRQHEQPPPRRPLRPRWPLPRAHRHVHRFVAKSQTRCAAAGRTSGPPSSLGEAAYRCESDILLCAMSHHHQAVIATARVVTPVAPISATRTSCC